MVCSLGSSRNFVQLHADGCYNIEAEIFLSEEHEGPLIYSLCSTHSLTMPPATITSRALRLKARTIEAAIRHLGNCIKIEKAATLALNQFQQRYTRVMINRDPLYALKRLV